jgi:hypothetical protein
MKYMKIIQEARGTSKKKKKKEVKEKRGNRDNKKKVRNKGTK